MSENSKNPVNDVIIMTTGGTIEKTYDEQDGSLMNRESEIQNWIKRNLRVPYKNISVVTVMAKDSLHMNDYDRTIFFKSLQIQIKKNTPIVVLHGTDTMAKTAKFCFEKIKNPNVPIIFTGAMRPKGFVDSDAAQNVAEALYAIDLIEPSVYISFHNRLFKLPQVRKNLTTKTFESI